MPPLFLRKFFVDFVETAIALLLAINVAFPHDVVQAQQVAIVAGTAVISAFISALRRAAPDFINWLKGVLGTG